MTAPRHSEAAAKGTRRQAPKANLHTGGKDRSGPRAVLALQASAGNAAVAALLASRARSDVPSDIAVQRDAVACPAPPVPPPGITAAEDPKFQSLTKDIKTKAKAAKTHAPAAAEAKKAQEAAVAPPDDKEAQAKAAQADTMGAAKPGGFDKAAFIAAVSQAIAQQRPRTNEDAQQFSSSGRAGQIKSQVVGMVGQGKQQSARDIAEKTAQPPDPGKAVEKPVTPLPPAAAPPALGKPDPAKAVTDRAPQEQVEFGATPCELGSKMTDANVTEDQLAKANEPKFTEALAAKQGAEQHAATAPAALRGAEAGQLAAAKAGADGAGRAGVAGMLAARTTAMSAKTTAQSATKAKDEQERARISGEIKRIFDATKTETEKTLGDLDKSAADKFDAGEKEARAAFEVDQKAMVKEYEDRRYSGLDGAAQ